jgi:hypothetical protein
VDEMLDNKAEKIGVGITPIGWVQEGDDRRKERKEEKSGREKRSGENKKDW